MINQLFIKNKLNTNNLREFYDIKNQLNTNNLKKLYDIKNISKNSVVSTDILDEKIIEELTGIKTNLDFFLKLIELKKELKGKFTWEYMRKIYPYLKLDDDNNIFVDISNIRNRFNNFLSIIVLAILVLSSIAFLFIISYLNIKQFIGSFIILFLIYSYFFFLIYSLEGEFKAFAVKKRLEKRRKKIKEEEISIVNNQRLHIIKPSFSKDLTWDFIYNNTRISAKMNDEDLIKIIDKEESFSKGDVMIANLEIKKFYDDELQLYILNQKNSYKIIKFISIEKKEQQTKLF